MKERHRDSMDEHSGNEQQRITCGYRVDFEESRTTVKAIVTVFQTLNIQINSDDVSNVTRDVNIV